MPKKQYSRTGDKEVKLDLRLAPDLKERLKVEAKFEGVSMAQYIRDAIQMRWTGQINRDADISLMKDRERIAS